MVRKHSVDIGTSSGNSSPGAMYKRLFSSLMQQMSNPAFIIDAQFNLLCSSTSFQRKLEIKEEKLRGLPLHSILDEGSISAINRELKHSIDEQKDLLIPIFSKKSVCLFSCFTITTIETKEENVYLIVGKNTSEAINVIEKQLTKLKKELNQIINNQHGVIFKFKKEKGRFVYTLFEGALSKFDGLRKECVTCNILGERYLPENREELRVFFSHVWETGESVSFEYRTSCNLAFTITLNPIIDSGKVEEVLGIGTDITLLKDAEQRLVQSEKLSVIGELSAGIAHEIRNPLTAIKGFLQLLKMEKMFANNKYLEIMESEIKRIELITSEFMVLSSPKVKNYVKSNVCQLADDVIFLVDTQAFKKRIQISSQHLNNPLHIFCEEYQIKQVFLNILKNGIDAMDRAGEIVIRSWSKQSKAFIEITDHGKGIPKELLDKLGEPFYTTKEKGNGLGLMISYKIIKEHGGIIRVNSEIGKGTVFTIELPLAHTEKEINR